MLVGGAETRSFDFMEAADQRRCAVQYALGLPRSVVIVGSGAAGNAAAEMLRHEGYSSGITMLTADTSAPGSFPISSEGYLLGAAPARSGPLRSPSFYREHDIELKLGAPAAAIDTASRHVQLVDGGRHAFDALLLATGAEPVQLDVPGTDLPHVRYLRTRADTRALVSKRLTSARVVVIGASVIGLEAAASLRAQNLQVDVVAPESVPMEKTVVSDLGVFLQKLHEQRGVTFHLGTRAVSIDEHRVTLQNGVRLEADLVVIAIGMRPATALAEKAGLAADRGIEVDEHLETSIPGIFAAGDIACWPDRRTGERIRSAHWAVAERQGQTAARNMLGRRERFDLGRRECFDATPFFWTEQYDFGLAYVGHAECWDKAEIDGQLDADMRNCTITYRRGGKKVAVAFVHRERNDRCAEVEFERSVAASVTRRDSIQAAFSRLPPTLARSPQALNELPWRC